MLEAPSVKIGREHISHRKLTTIKSMMLVIASPTREKREFFIQFKTGNGKKEYYRISVLQKAVYLITADFKTEHFGKDLQGFSVMSLDDHKVRLKAGTDAFLNDLAAAAVGFDDDGSTDELFRFIKD